jgi:hypothetical protein
MKCGLSEELNLFNLNLKGGRTSRLSLSSIPQAAFRPIAEGIFVEKIV